MVQPGLISYQWNLPTRLLFQARLYSFHSLATSMTQNFSSIHQSRLNFVNLAWMIRHCCTQSFSLILIFQKLMSTTPSYFFSRGSPLPRQSFSKLTKTSHSQTREILPPHSISITLEKSNFIALYCNCALEHLQRV